MNLSRRLKTLKPKVRTSPWSGREHFRGYGVMMLPFSSGHLLGLRVFPENDFAPYRSVWHRSPDGGWSIYNDGPSLRTTCPRWWGPALRNAELAAVDLTWTGQNELRVKMEKPRLEWTMMMGASRLLRKINAVSAALPLWTWKYTPFVRLREWMADQMLGMGKLRFSFVTPSGQPAVVMPEEIFFIRSSEAMLRGRDLGRPVRLPENPQIGGVPLPKDPVFMIGQAYAEIKDTKEYRQTREKVRSL